MAACNNNFIGEKSNAYYILFTNALANCTINFEWQTNTILSRSTIAIRAIVLRTEKPSHRVGVCIVKFNTIEAGNACSLGCCRKNRRKLLRQSLDVWKMSVSNALTIAKS